MDWLSLSDGQVEIASAPVSRADYARFAQEIKVPVPPRSGSSADPVTQVSPEEARAFAAWRSQHEGHDYRLPTLDEMRTLADRLREAPLGLQGALSEWLQCAPDYGHGRNGLRCIANVSWLRKESRANTRGALSEGRYPFVTFRLVRTNGR